MVHRKKIAIIGHFGGKETLLDGQTVKTQILYSELSENTDWKIQKVDTYYRRNAPFKLAGQLVRALFTTRDIIIITSQNGRRVFFPILYVFAKLFHTRVYHDVIGARLAKFTQEIPAFKKYLNSFHVNWVETASLLHELEAVGVTNVRLLPNFKRLKINRQLLSTSEYAPPYRLCTFSRVMQEKGIATAVDAVTAVNRKQGKTVFSLDIFGPVDPAQTEWFQKLQSTFPDYVTYRGKVHYENSVDTLKDYFALLFPTQYYTEGVPGTIIDVYAAGLPVIASKWESFSDVIDAGITGYGYEFTDEQGLTELLRQIADNPGMITQIKENCIQKAEYYLPEKSVNTIVETITAAS